MPDHPLFPVSVVTPEGPAFEGDAEMLIVPGAAGEIGVLARHAPLVAMLRAGSTRVHLGDGEVREFATGPGFFQVLENRAIALVDDAVAAGDIDEERARRQLEDAQEELAKVDAGESTVDRWQRQFTDNGFTRRPDLEHRAHERYGEAFRRDTPSRAAFYLFQPA